MMRRPLLRSSPHSSLRGRAASSILHSSTSPFIAPRTTPSSLLFRIVPSTPMVSIHPRSFSSSQKPPSKPPSGLIGMPSPPPRSPPKQAPQQSSSTPRQRQQQQQPQQSIIEVDEKNFVSLLKSPTPVILDCYADWCDPCKKLTPVLEAIVGKHPGKLILAKLDVDKYQELAMQLNVSNLPSVFGLFQGKLVDRFVGMPTEPILASFLEKLLSLAGPCTDAAATEANAPAAEEGSPEADLATADDLLAANQAKDAGALYKKVYEDLSKDASPPAYLQARCLAGLAKCALASGASAEAAQILDLLKKQHKAEMDSMPEVASTVSFVEVALQAPQDEAGVSAEETIKKLREQIKADAADLEARHKLALKYFQLQRFEAALEESLQILKRDKAWNEGAARALLLKIFEALGPQSDLAKKGRQRMTNYLFL